MRCLSSEPCAGSAALPAEPDIVGKSPAIDRMRRRIERVGPTEATVLISGETGTGKDLVARAIHFASPRRDRPFVAVNCASVCESLLAVEFFGAERGAYTGASTSRPGFFAAANGGTLFLDEVGDMPPPMQRALLRALESREVCPVGSTKSRQVDVRFVAASHRDLGQLVRQAAFREDLRYRLEVVRIGVPPLRERLDDLPLLCEHLLAEGRGRYALPECRLSADALGCLATRRWPGNVRELKHVLIEAALNAEGGVIRPEDIPDEELSETPFRQAFPEVSDVNGDVLRADTIRRALRAVGGNRVRAAKLLAVSRSTLYRYLAAYGIEHKDGSGGQPTEHAGSPKPERFSNDAA
jgi:DNA-binding NtrC family response regulator